MLRLTALMDDRAAAHGRCEAEHGLSVFVEYGDKRILFDCGQSGLFLENARALSVDLDHLDAVVLSHSHYDHARGFRCLAERGPVGSPLYTGPHFFEKKLARKDGALRDLSAGFDREFLEDRRIRHREIRGCEEIFPGVYLVSGFPRVYGFEKIPDRFLRQTPDGIEGDSFPDEVCMVLETEGGLAVLAGCAHPGILNMLTHIRELLGKPIRAVFGGTHLMEAEEDRILRTVDCLREMGLEILGLSHCSGASAGEKISQRQDVQGCWLAAGDTITLA